MNKKLIKSELTKILLIALILCLSISFSFIHKTNNQRIKKQEETIDRLRNRYDSITVEYIRYRIDYPRIK